MQENFLFTDEQEIKQTFNHFGQGRPRRTQMATNSKEYEKKISKIGETKQLLFMSSSRRTHIQDACHSTHKNAYENNRLLGQKKGKQSNTTSAGRRKKKEPHYKPKQKKKKKKKLY